MAQEDRTPVDPERVFARRFVAHHSLVPPVDVQALLSQYADIEVDEIPTSCEAVVLRKLGTRPKVIISRSSQHKRLRFTLAHELGHVVLPWQYGTVFCHPQEGMYVPHESIVAALETEAHHFASEILLPLEWLETEFSSHEDLSDKLVEIANKGDVNISVALIAAQAAIHYQSIFAVIGNDSEVKYAQKTRNCPLSPTNGFSNLDAAKKAGGIVTVTKLSKLGPGRVIAIAFPGDLTQPEKPTRGSTEILTLMLESLPAERRKGMQQSMSGITGAAKSLGGSDLYSYLRVRLVGHELGNHALMDEYIGARVHELSGGTKKSKKKIVP